MSFPNVRRVGLVGMMGMITFLAGWCFGVRSPAIPQVAAAEGEDAQLKTLLEQRYAYLKEYHAELLNAPIATLEQQSELNVHLRQVQKVMDQAEFELCNTSAERVSVLEKMLAHAKGYETDSKQVGFAVSKRPSWVLPPHVDVLDSEIALAREKSRKP